MPPESVDELCALPDQALVCPEGHREALGLCTFHGHEPPDWARGRLRDGFGISLVVFLPFDKRLHIRRRYQSHLVAVRQRHSAPLMRGGASFHRNYAGRLLYEKRHRPVRDNNRLYRTAPSAPIAQTWKLPFARSITSMLIVIVIDVPSVRFRWNHHGYEMPLGGGIHRISSNLSEWIAPSNLGIKHLP